MGPRTFDRRTFAFGAGAATLATAAACAHRNAAGPPAGPAVSLGYAALTWGDRGAKAAIDDIATVGYRGIQLRLNVLKEFSSPQELKDVLARKNLTFACFSGGGVAHDAAMKPGEIEKFMTGARFARAAGALSVQVTGYDRHDAVSMDRSLLRTFAETLNEIGRRTADVGLPLVFHNHMGQFGQNPDEIDALLAFSNPRDVKLLLDTGHYAAAGGDPTNAIRKHRDRLAMVHIKDVKDVNDVAAGGKSYEFVELGQGKVDFRAVFAALAAVGYHGWAVVELDTVPEGRAPRDAAAANRVFLEQTLGLTV